MNRYKIFEIEAPTHLPGDVRILNDPRLIGEVLANEIRSVGGAKAFGVECPTFAWFLAGGYYYLLLHEQDAHFNIDPAMKELSNLPGRPPVDFFAQLKRRMSLPRCFLTPAQAAARRIQPCSDVTPALKAKSMIPAAMGPGIPHEGMDGTFMRPSKSQDNPVFAAPSLPCLDGADPVSKSSLLDTWFRQIRAILGALKRRHGTVDVAFAGGGTVPIPDWFRDWCVQEGITILIIDPSPNQTAPP